jgi:hypothetical protein
MQDAKILRLASWILNPASCILPHALLRFPYRERELLAPDGVYCSSRRKDLRNQALTNI